MGNLFQLICFVTIVEVSDFFGDITTLVHCMIVDTPPDDQPAGVCYYVPSLFTTIFGYFRSRG